MGRKEVLAERRALENFYYNCKLETPQEVAKQFEVYTRLIWEFHQAGLCYDYYCDQTVTHLEGVGTWVGGKDALEVETLPTFSAYPNKKCNFKEIYAVGDAVRGYHFGQITSNSGTFSRAGATLGGLGDGSTFDEDSSYCLCECYVNKVEGRWCIVSEFVVNGQEAIRRRTANTRPFCKTILEFYEGLEKEASVPELAAGEETAK